MFFAGLIGFFFGLALHSDLIRSSGLGDGVVLFAYMLFYQFVCAAFLSAILAVGKIGQKSRGN